MGAPALGGRKQRLSPVRPFQFPSALRQPYQGDCPGARPRQGPQISSRDAAGLFVILGVQVFERDRGGLGVTRSHVALADAALFVEIDLSALCVVS